ncbi:hypothetical protein [Stackebrandtia albiflava]|nr:hypothetical protein [Stackebrandtia albiflava]
MRDTGLLDRLCDWYDRFGHDLAAEVARGGPPGPGYELGYLRIRAAESGRVGYLGPLRHPAAHWTRRALTDAGLPAVTGTGGVDHLVVVGARRWWRLDPATVLPAGTPVTVHSPEGTWWRRGTPSPSVLDSATGYPPLAARRAALGLPPAGPGPVAVRFHVRRRTPPIS